MNLTDQFLSFTLLGAEWVLWLLIILSVASVAVMIERAVFFLRRTIDIDQLTRELRAALSSGDDKALRKRYRDSQAMAARVALAGVAAREQVILDEEALTPESFRSVGKLAEGTRRPLAIRPADVEVSAHDDFLELAFALPAGCYATAVMREVIKGPTDFPE